MNTYETACKESEYMDREQYYNVLEKAVILPSNNSRLENFLSTSKSNLSVAFLGGSITSGSQDLVPYPDLFMRQIRTLTQNNREYNYSNLGYGCFNSLLGITLLDKLISINPDLVILEYAVNNTFDDDMIASFEGIIRRLLIHNPKVSILIVCSMNEYGFTCEPYMQEIATHYSLPVISLKNALSYAIDHGFRWNDFFYDFIHPSSNGQQLIADCLMHLLDMSLSPSSLNITWDNLTQTPVCQASDVYAKSKFIGANEVNHLETGCFSTPVCSEPFDKSLAFDALNNDPYSFSIRCRRLYIIYEINYEYRSMGQIKIDIEPDHQELYVDGSSIFGWGTPTSYKIIDSDEKEYHISIQMQPFDKSKSFIIYGFLFT